VLEKKPEHKPGKSGYCRKNSRITCNQIDPKCENINNCVQNSLSGGLQREPGENHLTGRTPMLLTDTRCQQVNADCCPLAGCLSGEKRQRMLRLAGTITLRPAARQPLSPLLWILQAAVLQISPAELQKCFSVSEVFARKCYFIFCIKKKKSFADFLDLCLPDYL